MRRIKEKTREWLEIKYSLYRKDVCVVCSSLTCSLLAYLFFFCTSALLFTRTWLADLFISLPSYDPTAQWDYRGQRDPFMNRNNRIYIHPAVLNIRSYPWIRLYCNILCGSWFVIKMTSYLKRRCRSRLLFRDCPMTSAKNTSGFARLEYRFIIMYLEDISTFDNAIIERLGWKIKNILIVSICLQNRHFIDLIFVDAFSRLSHDNIWQKYIWKTGVSFCY